MRAGVLDWQAVLGTGDHSGGAEEKEVIITACTEVIEMSKYTVHQIKIDFHVTEQICRFVYVYIIEGESLYLIDSGVFGCEKQIIAYLNTISDARASGSYRFRCLVSGTYRMQDLYQ